MSEMTREMQPEPDRSRRPVTPYTPELAATICGRIEAGESLRAICAPRDMPGAATVHRWAALRPDFAEAMRRARLKARQDEVSNHRDRRRDRAWRRSRPWARPDAFEPGLGEEICRRIAAGQSMLAVCAAEDMPVAGTVYEWLRNHPEFAERYVEAREAQAELMADLAWEIALRTDRESAPVARLQFDVIRWRAARLAPKAYLAEPGRRKPVVNVYVQRFDTGEIIGDPVSYNED
ncbi:MAG: hypothetical protein K0Q62_1109 [Phenylobacterium sp.]|nr:hypothetical protein [Phenylobacterium sp.]